MLKASHPLTHLCPITVGTERDRKIREKEDKFWMDMNRRRAGARVSVAAGSVWESRMKSDEVRGGVKVFNGEQNVEEGGGGGGGGGGNGGTGTTRLKKTSIGGAVATGKRKTWKSESSEGLDKKQIQIARGKSESQSNCGEQCKDLSISSSDGVKKSPIQSKKVKGEGNQELGASSADKFERSPIQTRKQISEAGESGEGNGKNLGQLRKSKSDSIKASNQSVKNAAGSAANGNVENSVQLRKTKSELDQSKNGIDDGSIPVENGKSDPDDENCKDFGVCQEKVISSSSDNVGMVTCSLELPVHIDGDSDAFIDDEVDEDEEEEVDEENEIEIEKKSLDVKEISIPESKVVKEPENKVVVNESQHEGVNEPQKKVVVNELQKKKVVSSLTQRRSHQIQNNERTVSVPLTVKQSPPPIRRHSTMYQNFSKPNSIPKAKEHHGFAQTQNKVQSLVDLIMWRDTSRSAFVFGVGTFILVSSSYAKDINFSLISVMSYMGLVYLAVIFLYRSLICRGVIDVEDKNYVLGEEEAIWVLKLILPYLNEFLLKLRALFSGDPGTTIKLAVLLFVLARCGSSITIWKMAKFGFFGVFTVPKICSSYSAQLTAFGNFYFRRFRDAWESCSHKKAVALGIFGLVWNLSSAVARIWAVFVLFVAFRYYQQHYLVRDESEWMEDEAETEAEETWQQPDGIGIGIGIGRQRQGGRAPNLFETNKVKKGF